ncbi:MAG: TIGR02678 family protein, partial [Candidatus Dormibacteraceae bacterium]
MSSDSLGDVLDRQPVEERRRAARALLRRPLLTAGADPTAFALVRRHAERLRQTFWDEAGWALRVDSRIARLRKEPADSADVTRPALAPPANQAFSSRRYVVLCLVLAALERADRQVTLGRLADQIVLAAGDTQLRDAGFAFTLDSADARRELVAVVRLLLELHALERVAGDEGAYVAASGDALYDVDRRVLGGLM